MVNNGKSIELKKSMGWHIWNMCRYIEWNIHTYTKSIKKVKQPQRKDIAYMILRKKQIQYTSPSNFEQQKIHQLTQTVDGHFFLLTSWGWQFISLFTRFSFTSQVFFVGFLPSTSYLSKKFLPVFQAIFRFQDFIIFQMLSPWPAAQVDGIRRWDPRVFLEHRWTDRENYLSCT